MNGRFKKVFIILLSIIAAIALGVGGYFLVNNLSSYTVYSLRILTENGKQINDIYRYLQEDSTNHIAIEIESETSKGYMGCTFTSTDKSVAQVVYKDGGYYVEYYKAGNARITAYNSNATEVYDSFNITVYDNMIADIVIDEQEDNVIDFYGDGTTYVYSYKATGVLEEEYCNTMQTRVVDNYNKNVIESISIDNAKNEISIKSELVTEDSVQRFYLQTFYIDNNGVEHIVDNYEYTLNVIGYYLVDLQLVVSESANFSNNPNVYFNTTASVDDSYLEENEIRVPSIVLTPTVNNICFKVRGIYSNQTYKDISGKSQLKLEEVGSTNALNFGWSSSMKYRYLEIDYNRAEDATFRFSAYYKDTDINSSIERDFTFKYLYDGSVGGAGNANTENYEDFQNDSLYVKVVNSNGAVIKYSYIYWDNRYKRLDAITDSLGNIVGFLNGAPNCPEHQISE